MINVDLNNIVSKRSGITAIAIWMIASLAGNGTWYGLIAMVLVGVLAWRYMDLDHAKQKWRIEAGANGSQKAQKTQKGATNET